jgi:toxin-antitoxin system PIN domain toxin
VKLVDANVLLYAVDEDAAHHAASKQWLDAALSGAETVLLPWVSLLAFLRISTHPSVYENPLPVERSIEVVEAWLGCPQAVIPEADARHPLRLKELLGALGRGGNLVNDAHLAALALQYRAAVVTFDNDFGRFPGVRWETPGVGLAAAPTQ